MLLEELLILGGIPFLLLSLGYLSRRAELLLLGGIGLIVVGTLLLASPLSITQNVNSTNEIGHEWDCSNITGNYTCSSYETTYTYTTTQLNDNSNLFLGVLLTFTGVICLLIGLSESSR